MVLIFSTLEDPGTAFLCTRLLEREVDFLLLDARLYRQQFHLSWSLAEAGVDGWIDCDSRRVPLREVRSAWVRWLGPSDPAPGDGPVPSPEARTSLVAFLNDLPALVVNRPAAGLSNGSKPYQQQLIERHGFRTPRTLVTTVPEEARRFYETCGSRVVYKSISATRSIVTRMQPEDLDRLEQVRRCPTQFQEYIPGTDIRVHTVGRRLFASEVETEATDYRYAGREGASREIRPAALAPELAERCLRLAQGLGLVVAGIDLRRSPDGEYHCFEANPAPMFDFYQHHTRQRIGEALVELLCRGTV